MDAPAEDVDLSDEPKSPASEAVTLKLRVAIKPVGKNAEPITELTLKPNARAFKDAEIQIGEDGNKKFFVMKPYAMAIVGLRMAGYMAGAENLVDKLDPRDLSDLAMAAFGFLG